jgi:excisionase family DNA binding protein
MKTLDLAAVSGTSPPRRSALLTIPQVASVLHCTTQHVRNLIQSKALRAIDIGCAGAARRTRRIQPQVLEKWLTANASNAQ